MNSSIHPKSKAVSIIFAALLLLSGCALEEKGQWVKPGGTEAQWIQDNYECTRDATYYVSWGPYPPFGWHGHRWPHSWHYPSTTPRLDHNLYAMCLKAKGYAWQPAR